MTLPQLALILATLGIFVVYWSCQRQRRHLPPGPKKLPFIGNLLSIPTRAEWETFTHWGKKYSKITVCIRYPVQYSSHALHRLRHYSRQRFGHIYYYFEFLRSCRQPPPQKIWYLLQQVSSNTFTSG